VTPTFALDTPVRNRLDRVTRFNGWWLEWQRPPGESLFLAIDGLPVAALQRIQRPDLGRARPDVAHAAATGFLGDLVLAPEYDEGATIAVAVCAKDAAGNTRALHERGYVVAESHRPPAMRQRAFDLGEILAHPTGMPLVLREHGMDQSTSGAAVPVIAGVPHFHGADELPLFRLLDTQPTHRLGQYVEGLLADNRGLALDFGAGVPGPDRLRENVVNLELIHFPNIDVCSSTPRLPFRDGAFGLVFSLAVFEHLPDPRAAALEVARVLAPGGLFFVDTAFLQPLHGDPDHYFNMTMSGLRHTLEGFDVVDIGVKINHTPSKSLAMQIESVLPLMREGSWHDRLKTLLGELRERGAELDDDLGAVGRETLAAGFYALARRSAAR
jgi:SAM-dependent methyltransferase